MLKTSKKVLSVVLALVLVLSTLTVCSFAAFDSSTQKLGFVLVPDKDITKVQNGDKVTFTLYLDVADFSQNVSVAKLLFLYDSSAYSVDNSYTCLNDFAKFYKDGTASSLASTSANWKSLLLEQLRIFQHLTRLMYGQVPLIHTKTGMRMVQVTLLNKDSPLLRKREPELLLNFSSHLQFLTILRLWMLWFVTISLQNQLSNTLRQLMVQHRQTLTRAKLIQNLLVQWSITPESQTLL